jgi:hypothetical protein
MANKKFMASYREPETYFCPFLQIKVRQILAEKICLDPTSVKTISLLKAADARAFSGFDRFEDLLASRCFVEVNQNWCKAMNRFIRVFEI